MSFRGLALAQHGQFQPKSDADILSHPKWLHSHGTSHPRELDMQDLLSYELRLIT